MKNFITFMKLILIATAALVIFCIIGYVYNSKRYDLIDNIKNKCNVILLKADIKNKDITNNLIDNYKNTSMENLKNIEKRLNFIDAYIKDKKDLTEEQKEEFIKYIETSLDNSINSEESKDNNIKFTPPVPVFVR